MKILILASNPRKDLSLDREIRDLQGVIERSRYREHLEVDMGLAVRVSDLQDLLLKHQPQIVHFCGHGGGEQGLVFESDDEQEQWVRAEALSDLFRLFANTVDCVLLNACYSEAQAKAIVEHINYVVGMQQAIRDDAAIAFSKGFYRALGYACSIEQAYEFGCNAIQLEISGSSKQRAGASEVQRKLEVVDTVAQIAIPEHLKPLLNRKTTLSPRSTSTVTALSPDEQTALRLKVDQALAEESASLKQYREQVRDYFQDHELADYEQVFLEQLRQDLGLSVEEADRILLAERSPIQAARTAYARRLEGLIQSGCYPFNEAIKQELRKFQIKHNLTDQEVAAISRPILEAAEVGKRKPQLRSFEFSVATVELEQDCSICYHQAQAQSFCEELAAGVSLEMVAIAGSSFLMGAPAGELKSTSSEKPQHSVTVPAFYMGKFAVTQAQWQVVASFPKLNCDLEPDPSYFKGANRPVETVSWFEAVEFCQRLSQKTGRSYRLPSEAEWEYACRAGTTTPFHYGATITTDLANYKGIDEQGYGLAGSYGAGPQGIYREQTVEVGSFPPNAFGLYEMHGNVWEWCADHWHEDYIGAPTNGSIWTTAADSNERIVRGGSWNYDPRYCRSAFRLDNLPNGKNYSLGFRVVCLAQPV